jgi:hypothetical protein
MTECQRSIEVWHTYTYTRNGKPFGAAKWRKQGNAAEFHNEMYQSGKSALVESRALFQKIKEDMALAGCECIVVSDRDEYVNAARLKYWRFMGFRDGGSVMGYTFSVQGVTCQQQ